MPKTFLIHNIDLKDDKNELSLVKSLINCVINLLSERILILKKRNRTTLIIPHCFLLEILIEIGFETFLQAVTVEAEKALHTIPTEQGTNWYKHL